MSLVKARVNLSFEGALNWLGIITTYLVLRLLVVRGFPNIYPKPVSVPSANLVSDHRTPGVKETRRSCSPSGRVFLKNRRTTCHKFADMCRSREARPTHG
jgi:hypothetical protein